jgi:hypothetical protein
MRRRQHAAFSGFGAEYGGDLTRDHGNIAAPIDADRNA